MTGGTKYEPGQDAFGKSYADRLTFIGDSKSPILWVKRGEIKDLFTSEFWCIYERWRYHHNGVPVIDDDFVTECVISMEELYKMKFSSSQGVFSYLKAIIERQDALLKRGR